MNFRDRRRGRAPVAIDITSLVDVVFLLLIFLLITTTFKRDQHAFTIELPTSSAEQKTVETDRTTVYVTEHGELYLLKVPSGEAAEAPSEMEDADKVTPEELKERLGELRADNPDASVAVRGEKRASYQRMIDVVALLEQAGFRNIWFPYRYQQGQQE